jgi:hypothetical protein
MAVDAARRVKPEVRGWLRHLWRKAMTPDDWSRGGEPHPWWDRYSLAPMLSFPRFDLSESSYAFLPLVRKTPAWREAYTSILDALLRRHTTYWAAVDWLTQFGPDPDRANYPKAYMALIPKDLWGNYDTPGWTANGLAPWGLQPDPIGADGNLFFRGFFNLMLAIHREVSGEATWDKPFEVAGLDDRTFSWSHPQIAEFLSDQWSRVPDGPHCENTKVWPFCLSAAGLGLQLTDKTLATNTHWVYDRWVEDRLTQKYMGRDRRGNLKQVALYYDPLIDRVHGNGRAAGLAPSIYVLPQNRQVGEELYRNAVAATGWDKWYMPVVKPPEPRMMTIAFLMARELGDSTTARRLGKKLTDWEESRFFNAGGASEPGDDEYGFFFHYDEPYPRGQESALYVLKDLLHGEGDWWRCFNEVDTEKFAAPSVTGAGYPAMGFSVAFNDTATATLELESYVASQSARGSATRFSVQNLPDSRAVKVVRDGAGYGAWRATSATSIEIETDIDDHAYEIYTGYRGVRRAAIDRAVGSSGSAGSATVRANRASLVEIVGAVGSVRAGTAGCPCCVATMA